MIYFIGRFMHLIEQYHSLRFYFINYLEYEKSLGYSFRELAILVDFRISEIMLIYNHMVI